ncbi:YkgJ family cysteine cluster protein [Obesumbacterium proteus]|uniref:YkgJ family cysteine cluster protein n=1 Tax=Obesumbacterium proteus TaxID=82983 RepID=UPI00157AF4C0|nr:YkgJ family cysteine cluster protein [Obesumbacterium proteus]
MSQHNPCISCGACCGYFRVSFYWAEADDAGGLVPASLTEQVNPYMRCMQGTNTKKPRCINLRGEIGQNVMCSMYENRPSPCREFSQSWEFGEPNEACDRARAAYGLAALTPPNAEEFASKIATGCHFPG